ncbi:MAG: DUF5717 family protein [Clostridiales bacterium]|nr:DUF5717 family protein [Clostridiales bacterium]
MRLGEIVKEKIEQMAKGIFEYEHPKILLSEEAIEIVVETGSTYQGSFSIRNSANSRMKGVVYSSSRLLRVETEKFIGAMNIIRYHYSADYLDAGDEFREEISIITDCGEITIPVHITIEAPYCDTSLGKIKDLFQFTNLAKTNWTEAKQVFKSEKFEKVLEYYDKQNLNLYKSLIKSSSVSQALDEFLVATHKKNAITIHVDKTEVEYEAGPYNFMDKLTITKAGWGYGEIRITSDQSFIELERKMLWTDNFINNKYEVNFIIKAEGMKEGLHRAVIRIETVSTLLKVNVSVRCTRAHGIERVKKRKIAQIQCKLAKNYMDFRLNRIPLSKYISEAEQLLHRLLSYDNELVPYLIYQLHIQMLSGKENTVATSLFAFEEKYDNLETTDPMSYGLLLYLKTLQSQSTLDAKTAYLKIKDIFQHHPKEVLLFWCLLYLNPQYERDHQGKYQDIKEQWENGLRSPFLLYEAAILLLEEPTRLRSMDGFERQLIIFMIRQKILSKEIALMVAYLIGKEKGYYKLNLLILQSMYEEFKSKEILQCILSLLIRNHIGLTKYHDYFAEGIREQLRVTELPEYYIYSMNEAEYVPLHPAVLTYFNFNNCLPEKKKAFYYCCMLENAKTNPDILIQHRDEIIEFMKQQMVRKNISNHLAVLCDALITEEVIEKSFANQLPELSFLYELDCPNDKIKAVAVCHQEIKSEEIVPVVNNKAYIHLLTDNAQIVLIDTNNQRFYITIGYSIRKMAHLEKFYDKMMSMAPENAKLLIALAGKAQYYQKFDEQAVELRKKVALLPELTQEYRKDFIQTLIHYYYDNFEGEILESYLMKIDLQSFDRSARSKLIEFMIVRDLYNIALKAMSELGYEGIEIKRLLKLCSRLITNADGNLEYIDILVEIAHYVFLNGRYDVPTLEYLNKYFNGTTAAMYDLWKCSKENNLDVSDLEERLLGQMLFAESYMSDAKAVFMSYYNGGCNHKLIRAFLSYYAYKYIVFDRIADAEIFTVIRHELNYDENEIALQAYLKYQSTQEHLTESEINFIDYHLKRFEQKQLLLPFCQDFRKNMRIPQNMYDKYYVEYRCNPQTKVMIHYSLDEDGENTEFTTEEMVNMYYGIFVKEFTLFRNETLQYYISEIVEDNETITESQTITIEPDTESYEEDNYYRINHIIEARDMNDDATLNRLLESYANIDHYISTMFHPI